MKRMFTDALNWLNGIGSVILAYALLNPNAAQEFLSVLPARFQTPAALAMPALWFLLVQFAKARSVAKAKSDAA